MPNSTTITVLTVEIDARQLTKAMARQLDILHPSNMQEAAGLTAVGRLDRSIWDKDGQDYALCTKDGVPVLLPYHYYPGRWPEEVSQAMPAWNELPKIILTR